MGEVNFATLKALPIAAEKSLVPLRRMADGKQDEPLWAGRDGALVNLPWKQALVLEGRVFTYTVGTLSTGIVGGGNGTVLDIDQPEFLISVPSGTAIIPLSISIEGLAADAIADHSTLEALIAATIGSAWDGTGTATTETPSNLRTDSPRASACSCRSAFTADITTAPVHTIDLAREEVKIDLPANGETPIIVRLDYTPEAAPVIVGPAMITGYWGGTSAVTGFAQVCWAEFQKSEVV